jgi:hypothetical protein
MSATSGMMKPPRSSLPSTVSAAGATSSLAEVEAAAEGCAAAMVGAVIKATEAAAAISPLKATSASPFVLESDRLDSDR